MTFFTIALLQLPAGPDPAANLARGLQACREARALGADLALFPEMWNIGYTGFVPEGEGRGDRWRAPGRWGAAPPPETEAFRARRAAWQAQAVATDGPYVDAFRALARELELAIAVTYLQAWPGAPRNAVSLIDRRGELVFTYAKVHTCDFDDLEAACLPGDDFYVAALDTAAGAVAVGALICYDREFPESARVLMLKGAELLLIPNACELERHRLAQLQTRAYENMVGVALANYAGGEYGGGSVAFDGIAFGPEGSRDMTVAAAGPAPGITLARFDLGALRAYRQAEVWGNAFRRPRRYGLLTAPVVLPPFVRVDERGQRHDLVRRYPVE